MTRSKAKVPTDTTPTLTPDDRAALELCLRKVLAAPDRARAEQIRDKLREDWFEAAEFCSYICQTRGP
jgi:hypothetical protein